ncbi:MAG: ABC transporter permease, partial [Mesorhizobium sp.]
MTDITATAPAIVGRSLWGDAWARLKANRAAMFSLYYLVLIGVVSVFGPWFVPHQYTTIYADYVRMPPSLSAYPKPEMIETALTEAIKRMRVDIKEWHQEGSQVFVTVKSTKPIDDRNIRYLDRSDAFDDTKIESKSPDGLEVTMSASVKQQYFLFGTDNTGRDLLSRTLMAGRISLAIGLLAGIVAVVIGVIYGA